MRVDQQLGWRIEGTGGSFLAGLLNEGQDLASLPLTYRGSSKTTNLEDKGNS
jgi:hypothetical protein